MIHPCKSDIYEVMHIVNVIDQLDLSDWMIKNKNQSTYMYKNDPTIEKIKSHPLIQSRLHSSCSFNKCFKYAHQLLFNQ